MRLTASQQEAERRFQAFLDSDDPVFGLFGYAGTGKSTMLSRFIKDYVVGEAALLASPTHKAAHVMRSKLAKDGVDYQNTLIEAGVSFLVVGTTAQLLGIRPVISDEQDETEMKFAKAVKGYIEKASALDWVIIDEVSMFSQDQFNMVRDLARARGAKVMVVGDPGQLPPVKADRIKFDKFRHRSVLQEVCRTADDTGITALATAVRNGEDWRSVRGSGVDHVSNASGTFLAELTDPVSEHETDWSVYVAYRNAAVNATNQAACMKIYGHGRLDVAQGEVVVANNSMFRYVAGQGNIPLCTNGETLVVEAMGRRGMWGVNVEVRSVQTGTVFMAEYLPEDNLRNPDHPYNAELRRLREQAQALEKASRSDRSLDGERRSAWVKYFNLRDNTVLSLSHPFAMTSHKSQGSTYRRAFVDATDMAPFDQCALYVGVTRPSDELVVG